MMLAVFLLHLDCICIVCDEKDCLDRNAKNVVISDKTIEIVCRLIKESTSPKNYLYLAAKESQELSIPGC